MKKALNTNLEIYNYLNIVDKRLGKIYKYTGYSSLPDAFDVNEETIKEVLVISQMRDLTRQPDFLVEGKRHFKKRLKLSLKNCRNILKHEYYKSCCTKKFKAYLDIYFDMRKEITAQILKDTHNHDFDEAAAWQEIFNLNPVLGELTENLFEEKVDFEKLFSGLERKYNKSYAEKVALLEKKENKKRTNQIQMEEGIKRVKKSKNIEKDAKIEEKSVKIAQKTAKNREIQQIRADIKKNGELNRTKNQASKNSSKEKK